MVVSVGGILENINGYYTVVPLENYSCLPTDNLTGSQGLVKGSEVSKSPVVFLARRHPCKELKFELLDAGALLDLYSGWGTLGGNDL